MTDTATPRTEPLAAASGAKAFRCHVTYFEDGARVTAKGRLDFSTVPVMRRMVLAAAALPISGVTLDLAGVESIDRIAVDALVAVQRQVRDQNSAFRLAFAPEPVRLALDGAGVAALFDHESLWSGYPSSEWQA